MLTETTPQNLHRSAFTDGTPVVSGPDSRRHLDHEAAVDAILDDCFLCMGQGIGLRGSLDFQAVQYIRQNFRQKFLAAMNRFGNRWLEDRATVTAVAAMLGERAVRYADGAAGISVEDVKKASADVERYCRLHAARGLRGAGMPNNEGATALIAGYWCTIDPPPAPTK